MDRFRKLCVISAFLFLVYSLVLVAATFYEFSSFVLLLVGVLYLFLVAVNVVVLYLGVLVDTHE